MRRGITSVYCNVATSYGYKQLAFRQALKSRYRHNVHESSWGLFQENNSSFVTSSQHENCYNYVRFWNCLEKVMFRICSFTCLRAEDEVVCCDRRRSMSITPFVSSLGGVVVSVFATGSKVLRVRTRPGDGFLREIKIRSTPSSRMGSKAGRYHIVRLYGM
jgi:hypothetical protein